MPSVADFDDSVSASCTVVQLSVSMDSDGRMRYGSSLPVVQLVEYRTRNE